MRGIPLRSEIWFGRDFGKPKDTDAAERQSLEEQRRRLVGLLTDVLDAIPEWWVPGLDRITHNNLAGAILAAEAYLRQIGVTSLEA